MTINGWSFVHVGNITKWFHLHQNYMDKFRQRNSLVRRRKNIIVWLKNTFVTKVTKWWHTAFHVSNNFTLTFGFMQDTNTNLLDESSVLVSALLSPQPPTLSYFLALNTMLPNFFFCTHNNDYGHKRSHLTTVVNMVLNFCLLNTYVLVIWKTWKQNLLTGKTKQSLFLQPNAKQDFFR